MNSEYGMANTEGRMGDAAPLTSSFCSSVFSIPYWLFLFPCHFCRRASSLPKVIGSLTKHPARVSFTWYAIAILLGGVLLSRPVCASPDRDPDRA